jgi:hypothetical protein
MTTLQELQVETGSLPTTPIDDNLLRQFVHSQAVVNEITATALGGRAERSDDVFLADAGGPIPYLNQAIPTRPLSGPDDPVLALVDRFLADGFAAGRPSTLLSMWPTADLSAKGWSLVGHPALVLRSPAPVRHQRTGVVVRVARAGGDVAPPPRLPHGGDPREGPPGGTVARSAEDFATAERIAIEGYPLEDARGCPTGSLFPPALADTDLVVRLGLLDGAPVAIGNVVVAHGLVNLCLGATLPAARRRGVWEALVWDRIDEAADLPAVAYTSDFSRPGFQRMGLCLSFASHSGRAATEPTGPPASRPVRQLRRGDAGSAR